MPTKSLLFLISAVAAAIGLVHADEPTLSGIPQTSLPSSGLPSIPACAVPCLTSAATHSGCSGGDDLQCICAKPEFIKDALACIGVHCQPIDATSALQAYQKNCASAISITGVFFFRLLASPLRVVSRAGPA
ncbi:hypothetical protein C8Q77DRAFT_461972 [Trametes polyzona]|nr:hypothetical protein C8Q77DRAFT_461972 [Trametes polyzona]